MPKPVSAEHSIDCSWPIQRAKNVLMRGSRRAPRRVALLGVGVDMSSSKADGQRVRWCGVT
jgi:hypothetical protein